MGLLDKLFRDHTPEYPPLDKNSLAGQRLAAVEHELQQLMQNVSRPMEIVPSDHAAYIFIGRPPNRFGLAWIHNGRVKGFFRLVEEHGVTPIQIRKALDALREAYAAHRDAQHYTTIIDRRRVVVTVSGHLEKEVHSIIDGLVR